MGERREKKKRASERARERELDFFLFFCFEHCHFHFFLFSLLSLIHPPPPRKNEPVPFVSAPVRLWDARRVVPHECDDGGGESTAARGNGGGDVLNRFLSSRPRLRGAQVFRRRLFCGWPVARREETSDADDELLGPRGCAGSGEDEREKEKREREKQLPISLLTFSLSPASFFLSLLLDSIRSTQEGGGSWPSPLPAPRPAGWSPPRRRRERRSKKKKREEADAAVGSSSPASGRTPRLLFVLLLLLLEEMRLPMRRETARGLRGARGRCGPV